MKGWYGNSHKHSLASKGIRVTARGTMLANNTLFPQPHKSMSYNTTRIVFETKDGEEEIMLVFNKDFIKDIYAYTLKNNIQIKDSEGNVRQIELSDIREMLMLQPNNLISTVELVYDQKVISWMGIPAESIVVEYFPSLIGKEIKTEFMVFSKDTGKTGTVVDEYVEDDNEYGKQTYYKVEFEDDTVNEKVYFSSIETIDGKERKKSMIYSEEIPIIKGELK